MKFYTYKTTILACLFPFIFTIVLSHNSHHKRRASVNFLEKIPLELASRPAPPAAGPSKAVSPLPSSSNNDNLTSSASSSKASPSTSNSDKSDNSTSSTSTSSSKTSPSTSNSDKSDNSTSSTSTKSSPSPSKAAVNNQIPPTNVPITPSAPSTSKLLNTTIIAAIVGSIIGGVILFACLIRCYCCLRDRATKKTPPPPPRKTLLLDSSDILNQKTSIFHESLDEAGGTFDKNPRQSVYSMPTWTSSTPILKQTSRQSLRTHYQSVAGPGVNTMGPNGVSPYRTSLYSSSRSSLHAANGVIGGRTSLYGMANGPGSNRASLYTAGGSRISLSAGGGRTSMYASGGNRSSIFAAGGNRTSIFAAGGNRTSFHQSGFRTSIYGSQSHVYSRPASTYATSISSRKSAPPIRPRSGRIPSIYYQPALNSVSQLTSIHPSLRAREIVPPLPLAPHQGDFVRGDATGRVIDFVPTVGMGIGPFDDVFDGVNEQTNAVYTDSLNSSPISAQTHGDELLISSSYDKLKATSTPSLPVTMMSDLSSSSLTSSSNNSVEPTLETHSNVKFLQQGNQGRNRVDKVITNIDVNMDMDMNIQESRLLNPGVDLMSIENHTQHIQESLTEDLHREYQNEDSNQNQEGLFFAQ